ncbi:MAG: LuxR C-terminal-related transcriptional regulator [Gammaproteobacteria bacterium]|nr:LuxR C-terminal-related transcriptional regulator [Gammaproteobacteria bacterium]MDH5734803.1 LuxR C-terminal-related transcriptional regulator [Gammaproteobacteria bacterium]
MNKLKLMFEQCTDAILGINNQGNICFVNGACEKLLGYKSNDICDSPCFGLLCEHQHSNIDSENCQKKCLIPDYFPGQTITKDKDIIIQRANGESIMINVGAYYMPTANDDVADVYFSLRHIDCQRLLSRMNEKQCQSQDNKSDKHNPLTDREQEILRLASSGLRVTSIADQLSISLQTVRNHLKNIYPKFGVHSLSEAICYATRKKLV